MAQKIEVFSAGCAVCQETVEMVRRIVGTSHTIEVLDMERADVVANSFHRVAAGRTTTSQGPVRGWASCGSSCR